MPETNLFEIHAVDEDYSVVAQPTEWLKALPTEEQVTRIKHYLTDLEAEYKMVADAAERGRISKIMTAARHYLEELQG